MINSIKKELSDEKDSQIDYSNSDKGSKYDSDEEESEREKLAMLKKKEKEWMMKK